jgi:hypothetical protein
MAGSALARWSSTGRPAPVVAADTGGDQVHRVESQIWPLANRADVVGDESDPGAVAPMAPPRFGPDDGRQGAPLRGAVELRAACIVGADPGALAGRAWSRGARP